MKVEIEPATAQVIDQLLRIERECFSTEAYTREQILSLLKNPNSVALVARVGGDTAGFVIGLVEGLSSGTVKIGHIVTIDVAVKYRRKGIALILLNETETFFEKQNVEVVYLEVRADNQAARRLYHKQGYVGNRQLADYYSYGVHGLRLVKRLKPMRTASS